MNPSSAQIWTNLGVAYHYNKQMDQAEKSFLKAIEIDANYEKAYYNMAKILEKRG